MGTDDDGWPVGGAEGAGVGGTPNVIGAGILGAIVPSVEGKPTVVNRGLVELIDVLIEDDTVFELAVLHAMESITSLGNLNLSPTEPKNEAIYFYN